jgi:hypothetical protein
VAAAVGALGVSVLRGPALLRAAPAVALCAVLAVFGAPVWASDTGTRLGGHPVLKRNSRELHDAERILARAHRGDLILAPRGLSQTLLILSGTVTTVSPRGFFTRALSGEPGMHAAERRRLEHIARFGMPSEPPSRREVARVRSDLRTVGVDVVCVLRGRLAVRATVRAAGYSVWVVTRHTMCLRHGS